MILALKKKEWKREAILCVITYHKGAYKIEDENAHLVCEQKSAKKTLFKDTLLSKDVSFLQSSPNRIENLIIRLKVLDNNLDERNLSSLIEDSQRQSIKFGRIKGKREVDYIYYNAIEENKYIRNWSNRRWCWGNQVGNKDA